MPVREALLKLEVEDLVVSSPHKGFAVTELSADEVEDIFSIRIMLEGLATRLAIPRMTQRRLNRLDENLKRQKELGGDIDTRLRLNREFHTIIYEAASRPRMVTLVTNLRNIVEAYSRIYTSVEGRTEATLREHTGIYEACRLGNEVLGEQLAKDHLQNIVDVLVPQLRSSPETEYADERKELSISGH